MTQKFNPYHLVSLSPWPIVTSFYMFMLVTSGLIYFTIKSSSCMLIVSSFMLMISFAWWRDIHRESLSEGAHEKMVMNGLKIGMILFITSEILFFASFFWGFFHSSISPTLEIGVSWPPEQISPFNPMGVPLLNTLLLLSSGVSVTWCHHEMLLGVFNKTAYALEITILLGVVFTLFQGFEYIEAPFSMSDSSFGSTFFMATGFHGLHVLIGTLFLIVSLTRFKRMIFSKTHMVGFECAAWYWHFVDVVWIFLYCFLYWWSY